MLSGLVFCGECGYAMTGSTRYCGSNKSKYSTYRCGCKEQKHCCDNKEINIKYLDEYVLRRLKKLVFNGDKLPKLVKRFNKYISEKTKMNSDEITDLHRMVNGTNIKIQNILKEIEKGKSTKSLSARLQSLEDEKIEIESRIDRLNSIEAPMVTEDDILFAVKRIKKFIRNNNIPECRQFILDYVEKVIVYKDHVELLMKTGFSDSGENLQSDIKSA